MHRNLRIGAGGLVPRLTLLFRSSGGDLACLIVAVFAGVSRNSLGFGCPPEEGAATNYFVLHTNTLYLANLVAQGRWISMTSDCCAVLPGLIPIDLYPLNPSDEFLGRDK